MKKRLKKSGFVLLITLALVLIAGVALSGFARQALTGAVESQESLEELQQKWAVRSCGDAFGGRVGEIIAAAEQGDAKNGEHENRPIAALHVSCRLNNTDYELIFTDEQAKININRLYDELGRGATETAIRELAGRNGRLAQNIKLRPLVLPTELAEDVVLPMKFNGYGQIFENPTPQTLLDSSDGGLCKYITCWSSEVVNVHRASQRVISLACAKIITGEKLRKFLQLRQDRPYCNLMQMLDDVDKLDDKTKAKMADKFTDNSECYGLWVISGGAGQRKCDLQIFLCGCGGDDGCEVIRRYEFAW